MCSPDCVVKNGEASSSTNRTGEKADTVVMKKLDEVDPTSFINDNKWGPVIGAASLGLLITAMSITMPHWMAQRNAVGCDSFCQGSLTSLRSACSLTGAVLTGKWSDSKSWARFGGARRLSLWAGVLAAAVSMRLAYHADTVSALRLSVMPAALLQQNLSVLKAVFSEYRVSSEGERAASAGMLGMAAGLALMVGPALGATLFPTYEGAVNAGYLCLITASILIGILPVIETKQAQLTSVTKPGFLSFLDVPSARSPAALFLLTCRVLSTLSFHIFQTIWTVSLRDRFHFQPVDYGRFMSMVGLFLALSQGFVAQLVLDCVCKNKANAGKNRVGLLATCFFLVGLSRFLAFQTDNLVAIYILFAVMVTATGVTATVLTADSTHIAAPDELGSFFGLQAAIENGAGMTGPLIGGALGTYVHPVKAALAAVLALNAMVVALVAVGYDTAVLQHNKKREKVD